MLQRDNSNGFLDVLFHDFHMSCSSYLMLCVKNKNSGSETHLRSFLAQCKLLCLLAPNL